MGRQKRRRKPKPAPEGAGGPSAHEYAIQDPRLPQIWHSLDNKEKQSVLSIAEHEVDLEGYQGERLAEVLGNTEVMTTLRVAFVQAMAGESGLALPTDVLLLCLLRILEEHLLQADARNTVLVKLTLFGLWLVWHCSWHWIFRLGALLLCFGCISTPNPKVMKYRTRASDVVLLCFDDTSAARILARAHSFCCAVVVLYMGSWVSWFNVLTVVIMLPCVLLETERASPRTDQNALKHIGSAVQAITQLLPLYFCALRFGSFLFCFFFFFPVIACYVFGAVFTCLVLLMDVGIALRRRVSVGVQWMGSLAMVVLLYWTWAQYLLLIPHLLLCLLVVPDPASSGLRGLLVFSTNFFYLEFSTPAIAKIGLQLAGVVTMYLSGVFLVVYTRIRRGQVKQSIRRCMRERQKKQQDKQQHENVPRCLKCQKACSDRQSFVCSDCEADFVCLICKKSLAGTAQVVGLKEDFVHVECMVCGICKKKIANGYQLAMTRDGKPLHMDCI